jgi:hypothetical protein
MFGMGMIDIRFLCPIVLLQLVVNLGITVLSVNLGAAKLLAVFAKLDSMYLVCVAVVFVINCDA